MVRSDGGAGTSPVSGKTAARSHPGHAAQRGYGMVDFHPPYPKGFEEAALMWYFLILWYTVKDVPLHKGTDPLKRRHLFGPTPVQFWVIGGTRHKCAPFSACKNSSQKPLFYASLAPPNVGLLRGFIVRHRLRLRRLEILLAVGELVPGLGDHGHHPGAALLRVLLNNCGGWYCKRAAVSLTPR